MDLGYIVLLAFLIFGFGFVIFWHELGHFLAAKWAGVEVEQFAVGFGQALVSWRKGFGFKMGTSRPEYETRLRDWLTANQEIALKDDPEFVKFDTDRQRMDYAARKLGVSPTEYRLNWLPLGGYVKMLGQDDLDPNAKSDSPDSYNNKSIAARMVIVSAGVVMNVILAIALFVVLFMIGFNAPPPMVGTVLTGSPAQEAGIRVGDTIVEIDGWVQHDFTKIAPNIALAGAGEPLDVLVERGDDAKTREHVKVLPRKTDPETGGFLQIGVEPVRNLRSPSAQGVPADVQDLLKDSPLKLGESIVAVEGKPVTSDSHIDFAVLDMALQTGRAVKLRVKDASGAEHDRTVTPRFVRPFGGAALNIGGMVPRTVVQGIEPWSSAKGKLMSGDVIAEIRISQNNDTIPHPSQKVLRDILDNAGKNGRMVSMTVIRDDKSLTIEGLDPTKNIQPSRKGLGIGLDTDEEHAVIAEVLKDSAASRAGIPAGAAIVSIAGQAVSNWRDVHLALIGQPADRAFPVTLKLEDGQEKQVDMTFAAAQLAEARQNHFTSRLPLDESQITRITSNPIEAAQWGVLETRDLMVQFYNMIRRMVQGSVSPKNAIGPVGIFDFGSKIAGRGPDWVIWFLAMISANLAVVNFLPIPIVDGGLFLFLVLEKVMGRPLSAKAQGIVQLVGLALIVGVFLFVTYHDITRLIY